MSNLLAELKKLLDALVLDVWHVELSECKDYAEFRQGVQLMTQNIERTLLTMAVFQPPNPRVRRAVENLKVSALRMLELCREAPETYQGPGDWERLATIAASYEQFRIEAGHLYRLAVPGAFAVLRAAL